MSDLPKGWESTLLGDVCTKPQYGYTSKSSDVGTIRYLRTTDITKDVVDWGTVPYCLSNPDDVGKYQLYENDILVSRAGSVGFSHLYQGGSDDPVVFASYLIRFKPLQGIQPNFIKYFLGSRSYWEQISHMSAGIAVQNVNAQKLSKLGLPLPPSNEQKRIADKLDQILEEVNSAKARLDQIPTILKNFRNRVLQDAVSGALSKSVREELGDKNFKGYYRSLNILDNNFKPISAEELTVFKEVFSSVPSSWGTFTLESLVDSNRGIPYGIVQTGQHTDGGIPTIRCGDVKALSIKDDDLKLVSKDIEGQYQRTRLKGGEVVLAIRGTVGNAAVIENEMAGYNISREVAMIPLLQKINPYFIAMVLQSPLGYQILSKQVRGVAQQGINLKDIKRFVVALPSIDEQDYIVKRVRELYELASQVEEKYNLAVENVDQITQSVLAKAFRGELVPQDPNDEPASVLLERIKAEKKLTASKPKTKKNIEINSGPIGVSVKIVSNEVTIVRKLTKENILKSIGELENDTFSFEDIKKHVSSGSYDELKEVLFEILDDKENGISQVFDKDKQELRFTKVA